MQRNTTLQGAKDPSKDATPSRTEAYPRFWHLFGPPLRSGLVIR